MTVFTAKNGEVFIQEGGPGPANPLVSLGQCADLDDIVVPKATAEPILCRDANGNFVQVGEVESPPGKATTGITILQDQVRSALEKISCPYSLYAVQKTCKKKGSYSDFELVTILQNCRNEQHTYQNLSKRIDGTESGFNVTIGAWINEIRVVGASKMTVERIATAEVNSLNDIALNNDLSCAPACDDLQLCEAGSIACDAAGGATANVLNSANFGASWAAAAADPFGIGFHVVAIVRFPNPSGGTRILAGREGLGGAVQGQTAYSDDNGVSWTIGNVGGAAVGHGPKRGGGLFALDYNHIWLVGEAGYIYFSDDGGATWTAQESGVITAGDYQQVFFINSQVGIAGAPADVIAYTRDGGRHWAAAAATGGGGDILTVTLLSETKALIGTDDGTLWFSDDLGATWTQVTGFVGSGAGDIMDLQAVNEHVLWMLHNTAAPVGSFHRSIDGGRTWHKLTNLVTNAGLNALHACGTNLAFAVGEAIGGTGLIYRAYEG